MKIHDKDWAEQVATESPLQSIHHTLTLPDRQEHIIDVFKTFHQTIHIKHNSIHKDIITIHQNNHNLFIAIITS